MLSHLIDYLRAAVPAMRGGTSTLGRELELARAYLSIMQFRMGERLRFSVDAPIELDGHELPPTVIGTLIENAIKHGLESAARGGRIDIRAWAEQDRLHIEVADTGIGFTANAGSGVGLANARERLSLIYGEDAELDLSGNDRADAASGVIARISVPLAVRPESTAIASETDHADRPAA
jgi:sensor histidine kinase YesM